MSNNNKRRQSKAVEPARGPSDKRGPVPGPRGLVSRDKSTPAQGDPDKPAPLPDAQIAKIRIRGFKSHRDDNTLEIRPLTILAGENSGGKSSIIQPLLLMKQTLEAQHDPGVLELNGTCVKVDDARDLFWLGRKDSAARKWSFGFFDGTSWIDMDYVHVPNRGISVAETRITVGERVLRLQEGVQAEELQRGIADVGAKLGYHEQTPALFKIFTPSVVLGRCAHRLSWSVSGGDGQEISIAFADRIMLTRLFDLIGDLIHLPGLRGNPERSYAVTRVSKRYPGPFPPYTASVLDDWTEKRDERLRAVGADLHRLGLTSSVSTQRIQDTRVEVQVARLNVSPRAPTDADIVNIADVGFGASQVLPVVVALHAARPNQLVHIEQPELHLHPNAQVAMADLLLAAARRGVRVVVETHSSILLKAVQVAIAEDATNQTRGLVSLNWFSRDAEGATTIRRAEITDDGGYGDWPVDFADVEMAIQRRFLSASFMKETNGAAGR